ncbi:putative methyltransferase [Brevundimonas bullata]|uniref:Putative methyltransferase n=1 Tax=Brevundimonas bullata TaxID=13160 RepID=A0A7W7IM33_9CAUL|nr:class I SAM-dependent methyltransferase [Brevundimonas bullata]MBB4796837.1 putative methyltransferase [Brevundimonas bullata]MBB6381796.1 putative methyltransferase [Brevundimonas bullata]
MSERSTRRAVLAGACMAAFTGLAACGKKEEKTAAPQAPAAPAGPPEGSLEWAVAGSWRSAADKARDVWRHPVETLRFFGLQPKMTVVDFWPGSGWYAEILAPYLNKGGGTLYLAGFAEGPGADGAQLALNNALKARLEADKKLYGAVQFTAFGPTTGPVAPVGTADLVLFMRYVHAWMAAGIAEKAFSDAFAALRPGGVLGVEQHRLQPDEDQDPAAANGYVQEAFVKQLAAEAGFVFVEASEINANPADTKDHPFGVETLAPRRLTAPMGEPANPEFDRTKYDAIGESDRMTLKFRKPE